jgi:hypothetical protein
MNIRVTKTRRKTNFYLYDRKVPVLVVFKAGLCVVAWLFSLMFLNCTGAEASDSTWELANGEETGWVSVVSMLLNGVPAIELWAGLLPLNETGAVAPWK